MLHDDYETLKRRGMPEHPRLRYRPECGGNWFIACITPGVNEILEDAEDAADLIAMHALRWWLSEAKENTARKITCYQFGTTTDHACYEKEMSSSFSEDWVWRLVESDTGDNLTLIAAILAATKHLESEGE